jgi:hypothetical protein
MDAGFEVSENIARIIRSVPVPVSATQSDFGTRLSLKPLNRSLFNCPILTFYHRSQIAAEAGTELEILYYRFSFRLYYRYVRTMLR